MIRVYILFIIYLTQRLHYLFLSKVDTSTVDIKINLKVDRSTDCQVTKINLKVDRLTVDLSNVDLSISHSVKLTVNFSTGLIIE